MKGKSLIFVILALLALAIGGYSCLSSKKSVDFNAEVRPILNQKCLSCHGGVRQAGGFSLLFEHEALANTTDSGKPAIVPGQPEQSEMIRRILHSDEELRMPLEKEPLTEAEVDILKRWIKSGAKWEKHWAYIAPEKPEIPNLSGDLNDWSKNTIDQFIGARLEQKGLQPEVEADCKTLIRRVSLDLIGLPPKSEWVDQYCANPTDATYETIVDSLLSSPRFGERWAAHWMDLARYADTRGYEKDSHREIWHYRDWLIRAFNQNMPFDQFTIEQLAGDLLENPSKDQFIATAFHRNTMNNDEGGTDNEEYRVVSVLDRVNTTWEVWQGTSFSCVQCHSHPYDPIVQEEYYEAMDFFNQSADADVFSEAPVYRFFEESEAEDLEAVKNWITGLEQEPKKPLQYYTDFLHITEPKIHPHQCDSLTNGALADTKFLLLYESGYTILPQVQLDGKQQLLIAFQNVPKTGQLRLHLNQLDGPILGEIKLNGKERGYQIIPLNPTFAKGNPKVYIQFTSPSPDQVVSISWFNYFEGLPGKGEVGYSSIEQTFLGLLNTKTETVPIMIEQEGDYRRTTQVFHRGAWQDLGEEVTAAVPDILPQLEGQKDRLGFAKWLLNKENPLTARVIVNRYWEQLFGKGLVETLADFGTMGVKPSHPDLLDWLAVNFRDDLNWDLQALLKSMVLSATYRQASEVSEEKLEKDPRNILLARGPRLRLNAEQVRDQALAVSGLLSDKMYGKSVMPPQPDGIWQIVYNSANWKTSIGEDRYRRAIYTYWRRTSPYPSFLSFDSPTREVCSSKRISTNTPLQALVTLNDPVYVEAAIHLAQKALKNNANIQKAIEWLYKEAILRNAPEKTLEELKTVYSDSDQYYTNHPEAIQELLSPVAFDVDCAGEDCQQLAALTLVSNTILNLDAFITKE